MPGGTGGGMSDLLKGGLGGLLAGGAAGSILSGGLGRPPESIPAEGAWRSGQLLGQQRSNKQVAPGDLANALGADQIESLSAQSGLSRDELLQGLSKFLCPTSSII